MLAVQEGRSTDCLLLLLKHGADINHRAKQGQTSIQIATDKNLKETLDFLYSYKAILALLAGDQPSVPVKIMQNVRKFLF